MTAAKGFQAAGMYAGLRAAGKKPDLALVVCETDAVSAGKAQSSIAYCTCKVEDTRTVRDVIQCPTQTPVTNSNFIFSFTLCWTSEQVV